MPLSAGLPGRPELLTYSVFKSLALVPNVKPVGCTRPVVIVGTVPVYTPPEILKRITAPPVVADWPPFRLTYRLPSGPKRTPAGAKFVRPLAVAIGCNTLESIRIDSVFVATSYLR